MSLTAAQKQALRHIADGKIRMRNTGYCSWRIIGPSHPSVVGRLISLRLAEWGDIGAREKIALLTATGQVELAEASE